MPPPNETVRMAMPPVETVGSHTRNAVLSSKVTLTAPATANAILIGAETKSVRITLDGTDPTTTVGFLLAAGDWVMIRVSALASIEVIEVEASAVIQYQWLKEGGGIVRMA